MAKTAMLNIQLEPHLKKEVENIFKKLGISTNEAITMFYRRVRKMKNLPFEVDEIPNKETLKVMQDTDEGKNLVECSDYDDFVKKLGI